MVSTPCLVVSADKVATAIAFQSVMTAGSPASAADGVAAAVAVPAVRVIRSGTAAQNASHERAFAGRRWENGKWMRACISPPRLRRVIVVECDDSKTTIFPTERSYARPYLLRESDRGILHRLAGSRNRVTQNETARSGG